MWEADVLSRLLRRLRGLTGVGLTWATLWGTIGAGIGFALGALDPFLWQISNPIIDWAVGMAAYGFVSGVEIKNVFLQTGLPQNILAHIW